MKYILLFKSFAAKAWAYCIGAFDALDFIPTMIICLCGLTFAIGYAVGRNETRLPPAHYLSESLWEPVHSYRICMQDRSCVMFVRRADK